MIGICIDDVAERDSVKVRLIGKYHEGENARKAVRFQDVGLSRNRYLWELTKENLGRESVYSGGPGTD